MKSRISGIYCYYDNWNHAIIYVGKDSYIDKRVRHRQHYQPSRRGVQRINRVLQNDNKSGRYSYAVLEQGDFTDDELNQKEISWISFFKPKFNFTPGGDGVGSGENHPFYNKHHTKAIRKKISRALSGEKSLMYGKPGYWKNKKRPKETCEKIRKARTGTKHPKETREKMSENHADFSREKHPCWKNYARVIRAGSTSNGKQRYGLRHNGKNIRYSINKEKLEKLADEINKKKRSRI